MTVITHKPLGQLLIDRGYIHAPQLDLALDEQKRSNHQHLLGEILVGQNVCSERQVVEALAEADGIPFTKVGPKQADPRVVGILPHEFLIDNGLLPLFLVEGTLTIAMAEPSNIFLIDDIQRRTGHRVQIVAATLADIRSTLEAYLPEEKAFVVDEVRDDIGGGTVKLIGSTPVDGLAEPAVLKLVDYCIRRAIADAASEIHIEAAADEFRIRFRIDGRLFEKLHPPARLHAPLVARIKHIAGMNPALVALPQDGILRVAADSRTLAFNISTIPGRFGEKVLLRVTDSERSPLKLEKLGFSYEMMKQWRRLITMPSGLVIVAGPSGSGKRATLYSALQERNSPELNLCTVEDRVEQTLAGTNQFQVDVTSGFAFPAMLRAVLKHEPDIVMISDLPDANTARLAAQAALGGRLVFAAMYAVDAPAALSRLINFGVEPHLLGATVTGVLARRLVRKLCPHCRVACEPTGAQRRHLAQYPSAQSILTLYNARGCDHCGNLGYAGQVGVHELLVANDNLNDRLSHGISLPELRALAHTCGMMPLIADAMEKARTGLTTFDEVLRVTT